MALLQPTAAIYHHPLDSALTEETVKGISWTQTGGGFGASKVGDGFQPASGAGDMTGDGGSYDTTVGSTKLAFTSWLMAPSIGGAGYAVGAFDGQNTTTIDKLTFSTDDVAAIVSGLTVLRRELVAGFAGSAAGYACGGTTRGASPTRFSTIDKLVFADDSVAAIVSGLSGTRSLGMGGFDSATAGYACGGRTSKDFNSGLSTIDRVAFSDDSRTTIVSGLTGTRSFGVADFDSAAAGYVCGGINNSQTFISVDTIDKLTFSTDAVVAIVSGITGTRRNGVAGFAGSAAGYACGGREGGVVIGIIDKLTFSTDTVAANSSSLTLARIGGVGGFESGVAGYACGGTAPLTSVIDKLAFSDDSVTVNTSSLTAARGISIVGFES